MIATSPPQDLGNILGGQSKEHNVTLSQEALVLLSLFRQEFVEQVRAGGRAGFFTLLHWCQAALEGDWTIYQIKKGRRELKESGYITLTRIRYAEAWVGYPAVVCPGPRLAEEIQAEIEAGDGGGK